ncbi:MAG: hypothetical protein ACR2N7_00925 [Acidimicrobiia bacterium]
MMHKNADVPADGAVRTAPSVAAGAVGGVVTTAAFIVLHQLLISNIGEMFMPMAISGAACGAAISWSYAKLGRPDSTAMWFGLNGAYLATLLILGLASLIVFTPQWTFAELNVDDAPIGDLFSQAAPLMFVFSIVGAAVVFWSFGASRPSFFPILLAETLLVLLLGHNVAIIGLVELTSEGWSLVWLMLGLVAFFGVVFATVTRLIGKIWP